MTKDEAIYVMESMFSEYPLSVKEEHALDMACDVLRECDKCATASINAITSLHNIITEQWIPCSERLPEDVEIGEEYPTVIFCTKDAVYVGFYEYYRGGKWWAAEDFTVDNVIAWMPLPEAYKGGAK